MTCTKKIIIAIAAIVVALLVAADIAISAYLVNYAIGRAGDGGDRNVDEVVLVESEGTEARIEANRAEQNALTAEFMETHSPQEVQIDAQDGVHLSGLAYEHSLYHATSSDYASGASESSSSEANSQNPVVTKEFQSNRWVIVVHGYRDTNQSKYILDMVRHYYDAGFNVLTPDLRASGQSDGDYVGMGWLDRMDILDWVDWIIAEDPDAKIVIHGVSMGAATTMMVSGEETPEAVKAFVEDCGYTSVWDVFSTELSRRFGLPEFPLLYSASAMSDAMAGYSFEEASAIEAVAQSDKPMLFIHGTADDFIPFEMMGELYNAKTEGDKEMLVSEGAGHADAMYELGDAYWDAVFSFVDRYVGD